MKNHENITRKPDKIKIKQHSFQRSFLESINKRSKTNMETDQKKTSLAIPEWQFMDYTPEESQKEVKTNLYVTDWQMID